MLIHSLQNWAYCLRESRADENWACVSHKPSQHGFWSEVARKGSSKSIKQCNRDSTKPILWQAWLAAYQGLRGTGIEWLLLNPLVPIWPRKVYVLPVWMPEYFAVTTLAASIALLSCRTAPMGQFTYKIEFRPMSCVLFWRSPTL